MAESLPQAPLRPNVAKRWGAEESITGVVGAWSSLLFFLVPSIFFFLC